MHSPYVQFAVSPNDPQESMRERAEPVRGSPSAMSLLTRAYACLQHTTAVKPERNNHGIHNAHQRPYYLALVVGRT